MSQGRLDDEEGRLAALHRYQLEGGADESLDTITGLVQTVLDVPLAGISLIDRDTQIFKSVRGAVVPDMPRSQTLCAQAIAGAHPLVVADASADPRFADLPVVKGDLHLRAYLGVPLTSPDGYNVGAICAADTHRRQFGLREVAIMEDFARLVVNHLEMRQIAKHDFLTGALTRRAFQQAVERDFIRSSRYERPAALMLIDIDHFKKINDAFGHPAGDEALKAVAMRCLDVVRQSDSFGRLGGEEFAFLLPETTAHEAMQCAERIREVIEKLRFKIGDQVLSVTASFGVAALSPQMSASAQWFAAADMALYEAKRAGRNCCMLALPERRALPPADQPAALAGTARLN